MPRKCVIEGCNSKSGNPQHRGVTFHSFPFDSKTRDIWIVNCRISPDKNITKSVLVCSRHFRRADFQSIKSNKYILKSGAIPTIFPWEKLEYVEPQTTGIQANNEETYFGMQVKGETNDTIETQLQDEEYRTGFKRRPSDNIDHPNNPGKVAKLSASFDNHNVLEKPTLISSLQSGTKANEIGASTSSPRKLEQVVGFTPGVKIEAQDFNGIWHPARIIEVDNDEREVLIRLEKSGKNKRSTGVEEWIPMNSSRLRQKIIQSSSKSSLDFVLGEKCLARWSGSRRFPATISKVLGNDAYEVLFDDGYVKVVKGSHISKIKYPKDKWTSSSSKSSSTAMSKSKAKKDWPLISISSLNLEELNLPEIPQDGEWCCHWVNDQPIGEEGFLTVGDHRKPTVIVQDWRLPPNWTKHMYQRSNVLGKWDVILVNPQGKRFRSKADLKQYIEDLGQIYNPDIYDFSIHRRRAKDIGAYVYTKDYKPPPAQSHPVNTITTAVPVTSDISPLKLPPPLPPPSSLVPVTSPVKVDDSYGVEYVLVGSLKVQIIDNLFRCPQEGCNKNFRKENHLQIHIKHYHEEIAKLLGVFPSMQELASKRTVGIPSEDPLPKNHLPNAQFFAKLNQHDLQARTQRKSVSSQPSTIVTPPCLSPPILSPHLPSPPSSTNTESSISNSTAVVQIVTNPKVHEEPGMMPVLPVELSPTTSSPLQSTTSNLPQIKEEQILQEPHFDNTPIVEDASKQISHFKKRINENPNRKSTRQRLTKKYLTSNSSGVFDSTFDVNDLEETRHSFNGTPENKVSSSKRTKSQNLVPLVTGSDSNQDANSLTTGSIPENSQSPKYINENGEIIKIVRMKQEEIINCLCSYGEEDGLMIQCELCLCWQHGICNGIEKESQVPEKYICYICRNPQRGRSSLKYIHDQDWLYEGKLPSGSYHTQSNGLEERFEILRKSHTLTGNLLELKRFLHSLRVKINIAENKDHPKMYLWAKKWEILPVKEDKLKRKAEENKKKWLVLPKAEMKVEPTCTNLENENTYQVIRIPETSEQVSNKNNDRPKDETNANTNYNQPNVPQPEAPIDSTECQHRLLEHIQKQQNLVLNQLQAVESQITEIEAIDNSENFDADGCSKTKLVLSTLIADLEVMKNIAKINAVQSSLVT